MNRAIPQNLTLHQVTLTLPTAADPHQRRQWQRRVSTALERVDLHPPMPPQAILVVRHLADPNPGQLLATNPWQGLRIWERAAQTALNTCWHTARRPAQEAIPASANSVWFSDPAEWLACLSWDVYHGVASDRWWWQTTLRHPPTPHVPDTLISLWQDQAQWLPASLTLLWQHHPPQTLSLLAALPPSQIETLLTAIAQTYSLPLPSSPPPAGRNLVGDAHPTPSTPLTPHPLPSTPPSLPEILNTHLQPYLPPATQTLIQTLHPTTQALISLSLTLPQAHSLLQTPPPPSSSPSPSPPTSPSPPPKIPPITPPQPTPLNSPSPSPPPAGSRYRVYTPHPTLWEAATASTPLTPYPLPNSLLPPSQNDSPPPPVPASSPFPHSPTPTQTTLGGLWYLVNLLVALDWPTPSPQMTPWHQLPALAQALLPEPPPDPIWRLLGTIAGDPVPAAIQTDWQTAILPTVHQYLATHLEQPAAIADYLQEPATLYLTRTHIDVIFSLDQICLDIRLSGLDQNPGWVPELARVITFHYE